MTRLTDDSVDYDLSFEEQLPPTVEVCVVKSSFSGSNNSIAATASSPPSLSQSSISSLPAEYYDDAGLEEDDDTKHYPLRARNAVYALGGAVRSLPNPLETFPRIIRTEGMAFLFKPFGMDQLYRLLTCRRPVLLRRPFGWGIEIFAATFAARVAIAPRVPFDIFHSDECTMDSSIGLHQDTILALDLKAVDVESDIAATLPRYVHTRCQKYSQSYGTWDILPIESFLYSESPSAAIISYTASDDVQPPLILLIENFDEIQTPAAELVVNAFFHELEHLVVIGHIKALVLLSDMYDERPPVPTLQRTIDISHHPAFQTAVGCMKQDVWDLDEALAESFPEARGDVFLMLEDRGISPVLFTDPEWDKELPPSHPLRVAKLRLSEGNRGVYPLEPVMEVLTEKYSLKQP
ncbi:hypothetical protein FB45DRAFT_535333 [Roridomyces roridus]|uniref:Uncharacterized protein n=1 Tax=Roridomyces roridus TaxID=1738132 RepID=A0AAD7FKW0_9AGAR|nr:hypothetical protein FB45DRAFT_535333 [Roridomyces roridus]